MDTIIFEQSGKVGKITLNRPRSLNAVNGQMIAELADLFASLAQNDGVNVIMITGQAREDGKGCFSAGADLKEIAASGAGTIGKPAGQTGSKFGSFVDLCNRIEQTPKPVIAVIDGVCVAGGLELALSGDMRLAADTASIGDLHVKNTGGIGGGGAAARLSRVVGAAKAMEIMLTGEMLSGEEACRIGLVNRVFPSAKLQESALGFARTIAEMPADAVRMAKAAIRASEYMLPSEALRYSYLCQNNLRAGGKMDKFLNDRSRGKKQK